MIEWVKVCKKDEIGQGEMYSFDHDDKMILIANCNGKFYATDRICTHAEADLSTGFLNETNVTCPLHLSIFNLQDGKPQNLPAEKPLKTFNVKIEQSEIYIEV